MPLAVRASAIVALAGAGCGSERAQLPDQTSVGGGGSWGLTTGAGGTGGQVEGPGAVKDPDQVHIIAYVDTIACNSGGLVSWDAQDVVALGFSCGCDFMDAVIRPSDGRLIARCPAGNVETQSRVLREFHCDACPYVPNGGLPNYPAYPSDNDPILTGPCGESVVEFLMGPDGTILFSCDDNPFRWRDQKGIVVYDEMATSYDPLVHVGHGGMILTRRRIIGLHSSVAFYVTGLPDRTIIAARALAPGGFIVALYTGQSDEADPDDHELWKIDASGVATLVGQYPPVIGVDLPRKYGRLDPAGALFQPAGGQPPSGEPDTIIRRVIGGKSEVVYSNAVGPMLKVDAYSRLVTGP